MPQIVNLINVAYHWSEAELWVGHKELTNALEIHALLESGVIILTFHDNDVAGVTKIEKMAPYVGGCSMLSANPTVLAAASARPS